MSNTKRQFEPQISRSGGSPSKFRFTVRCSGCSKTDSYEADKRVSDDLVKGSFKDRGWVLGRDRAYDLCPACLKAPRKAQPPDRPAPVDKRHQDTAAILARHLGKPASAAEEVFRPKVQPSPALSAPEARQPASAAVLSPEVEQALVGIASDLKSLRSTVELMAQQMSQLVAIGGQQIEAITRLGPAVILSSDGICGSLKEVVSTIQAIATPAASRKEQASAEVSEPRNLQGPEITLDPEPAEPASASVSPTLIRRPKRTDGKILAAVSDQVMVKSTPDAKRPDRFYTTVRLPRELWDASGFGAEDRLQIDWTKQVLSVSRVAEGGVKPKTISASSVILQSWRLGNLNFDRPKVTRGRASLHLSPGS